MKLIFPLTLGLIILSGYQLLLRIPYHFYREVLQEGVHSDYLQVSALPAPFYEGGSYEMERIQGVIIEGEEQWKKLHFNNFLVSFPIDHPVFKMVPYIVKEQNHRFFGFRVNDYEKREVARVLFKSSQKFTLDLEKHQIFQLPLFEKMISSKNLQDVWHDLFAKNFKESPYLQIPPFGSLWNIMNIPLTDMVYDLFLLDVRERILSPDLVKISYWEGNNLGIIEKRGEETDKMFEEVIYFLHQDEFYEIHLWTLKDDFTAESYRQRFLNSLNFKQSFPESSVAIYADFKGIVARNKLNSHGFIFYYSAFTHQKESRVFLEQMIAYLERTHAVKEQMEPLYQYAWEIYGTNFSTQIDKRKESEDEKLKRQIESELRRQRKDMANEDFVEQRENFSSSKEKIQYYLKKAKESKEKKDKHKTLIVD